MNQPDQGLPAAGRRPLGRERRGLFLAYQVYKVAVVYPLLALSTALCGSLAALLAITVGGKAGSFFGVVWARFNSLITPMTVEVTGREKIDPRQSYVIAANHQSLYDIYVLYGWLPIDFRWVMKAELRKVPFLGYSCERIGHVFVDRSRPEVARAQINAARARIRGGTSIVFFAEGTRSQDGRLLPFKKGAFRLAADLRLPVLPITLVGTREILPNGTRALFPGTARLVVHDPIPVALEGEVDQGALLERARAAIQRGLDGAPRAS